MAEGMLDKIKNFFGSGQSSEQPQTGLSIPDEEEQKPLTTDESTTKEIRQAQASAGPGEWTQADIKRAKNTYQNFEKPESIPPDINQLLIRQAKAGVGNEPPLTEEEKQRLTEWHSSNENE